MRVVPFLAGLFRNTPLGLLPRLWHRLAPSFPVRRRVFGFYIYYDFRDSPYYWCSSRRRLETMESIFDVIPKSPGRIWDVGSNVGIFSLKAAQMGHAVVSFDISRKALRLLDRAAGRNRFGITTVPRAFAVETFAYRAPESCAADNRILDAGAKAPERSITYLEAAQTLGGAPQLIKMDIEGGEEAFLDSADFKQWLLANRIAWVVELHRPEFAKKLWKDVPFRMLDAGHCLINEEKDEG